MWHTKTWKLNEREKYEAWVANFSRAFEIRVIFVNNGYGVEWRKLREI